MSAYKDLVHRFHQNGVLREIFPDKKREKESIAKLNEGADIKTDIYNYCARFDSVPMFTSYQRIGRYGHTSIGVRIEFPQQNIRGVGSAAGFQVAETRAALNFKQEAEKYHAKHGQGSIIIKDSTSLTALNAEKFFEFYRIAYPKTEIRLQFTQSMEDLHFKVTRHRCQLLINDEPVGQTVEAFSKRAAEPLAYLTAAVALKEREPELFPRFLEAWQAGNGNILKPLSPIDFQVDEESLMQMRQTLISARRAGLSDEPDELASDQLDIQTARRPRLPSLTPMQAQMRNQRLLNAYGAYLRDARLDKLRRTRSELPINQYSAQVLDLVKNSTYSIIVGTTGSGKTTQVPQIILENAISKGEGSACNIICTQPRKIAATSVARRVSEERGEALQETVGYQVRFRSHLPKAKGSITFCTTGVLLKQLQSSPDAIMEETSHLLIDEVHERDINTDFLLVIVKKIMQQRAAAGRSTPKVVLMSATLNTELFAAYFNDTTAEGSKTGCPALNVPGRSFPVKEIFLAEIMNEMNKVQPALKSQIIDNDKASTDYLNAIRPFLLNRSKTAGAGTNYTANDEELLIDWKQEKRYTSEGELVNLSAERDDSLVPHGLVVATLAHIVSQSNEGAVLVFLPGLDDILKVDELLRNKQGHGIDFYDGSKFRLHMLHSSIDAAQTEVFAPVAPGCRKIILATNIAETSITIPDVQYVLDTGKLKEKQYDQARCIKSLRCTWISKSNSKQRAGRAGRVQNGHYYALFPKERYDSMRPIGTPEILRTDLQEVCLDIKAQAINFPVRDFLASAIEPPSPRAVDLSLRSLEALGAITPEEEITPLGRLLASLPVHPSLGKMIVLGVIFRCLDPMVVLGAAHNERNMFYRPLGLREPADEARLFFARESGSDHIAMLNAVREMRRESMNGPHRQWAVSKEKFISINTYKTIQNTARQIEGILVDAGLIQPNPQSQNSLEAEIGSLSLNQYSNNIALIKALVLAGLHPNLAVAKGGKTYRTPGEQTAMPCMASVNNIKASDKTFKIKPSDKGDVSFGQILSYGTMVRSTDPAVKLIETTQSSPLMAVLFGGKLRTSHNIIVMDEWLRFYVRSFDTMASKTILEFRKALERLLSIMFQRLRSKEKGETGNQVFPADEVIASIFTRGLVEILNRDVRVQGAGNTLLASFASFRPQEPTESFSLDQLDDLKTRFGPKSTEQGSRPRPVGTSIVNDARRRARGYAF